ncbi:ATP-binding cassette, subfamily B [Sporobacter termitidis DSM 10068]|uniref:ATP-binding cassette, subfamily B n=1 Tax=Sporobacter termitidis DSM 10068 TaxID=1123282 RepID=A0A1M5YDC8_9FIRM|nr:ABC transporter ATP-binding protein [Sporobacter termitidis]SHI09909.1 ATP-binding cassette, subfamily B [Sporobacter termitidis DSM 10068]
MRIYGKYFNKYKVLFLSGVLFVLLEALCDLMQPTIMSRIIDDGIKSGQMSVILHYGLTMLAVTAAGACFAALRNILASRVSQNFGADLREDVFKKIIVFSESSADKIDSGSLITRMTNDTNQITQFINGMMRIFVKAPVTCVGSIILAVLLSVRLSLVLLAAVAVVTVLIVISMRLSYKRFAKVQYAIDKVNAVVQEYLLGVRLVKAFGRYGDEEEKFGAANESLASKSIASQLVIAWFSPLMSLTINIGIVLILFFGSVLFAGGGIEVGRVSAFLTYMTQILASLIMITAVFNMFVRTKASTERIAEVLNSEEDFPGGGSGAITGPAALEFKSVTFAYPAGSGLPAIRDLSFEIGAGKTLAVIGPTGSGKSTLAWLCLHFYDLNSGAIYLNGADIKNMDTGTLRESVALAPQKSMLFSGTVRDNIAWGKPGATKEEIIEAAAAAQADSFISRMPEGYESFLGQAGVNLSGGQKQRVSIARALVRKAPVLILDDCTSALDAVTEVKVRRGIARLNAGTVVIITQRITTAMNADMILVLDNGRRVGFGSHRELLASCRIYKEIFDSQIGEEFMR